VSDEQAASRHNAGARYSLTESAGFEHRKAGWAPGVVVVNMPHNAADLRNQLPEPVGKAERERPCGKMVPSPA
jgi:hypothetical protein